MHTQSNPIPKQQPQPPAKAKLNCDQIQMGNWKFSGVSGWLAVVWYGIGFKWGRMEILLDVIGTNEQTNEKLPRQWTIGTLERLENRKIKILKNENEWMNVMASRKEEEELKTLLIN